MGLRREVKVWVYALVIMFLLTLALSGIVAIQMNTDALRGTTAQRLDSDEATHRIEFFQTRTAERP